MKRLSLAFRSFFGILFQGALSDGVILELGLTKRGSKPAKPAEAKPAATTAPGPPEGAVQILSVLQRDARLLDFLMEDISTYSDDQVGTAVREMHQQLRDALGRYVELAPVIDGVEGTFTKLEGVDPAFIKLVGNVPPQPPAGGTLRHRGWKCVKVELPAQTPKNRVLAPAEIEIE